MPTPRSGTSRARLWHVFLVALFLLGGCASFRPAESAAPAWAEAAGEDAGAEPAPKDESKAEAKAEEEEEDEGHGLLVTILLYIPNRVLDLFDLVRFGVDVGPGIGVHLQATDALQAKVLTSTSVGVGYQTLRHSPIHVGARSGAALGPADMTADVGDWYQSPGDVRVEAYVLLVGAHAVVEPFEILDAILGFVFIDLKGDDL